MREKILQELQKKEDDKVMLSFKTEKRYKHIFEKVCKHEGYSMSSILNALLKTYVNEFFEQEYKNIRPLIQEHDNLITKYEGSDNIEDIEKLSKGLLNIKDEFIKEFNTVFSLADNDHSLEMPKEDTIDFSRINNHADTVKGNIIYYTEDKEKKK